jgi:16S rRNA (guanine966-N2)-methyltransferase
MTGLRVIAGRAKGLRLRMVPGKSTRPISDRVKESLFNIIGADVMGSHFLDLFAGTGSVGIEALSRGAARVLFVDSDRKAVRTIIANLEYTQLSNRADIRQVNAFQYLNGEREKAFDYIYVAPPQYERIWSRTVRTLDAKPEWLNPDAWVIAQMHPVEYEALRLNNIRLFDQRKYGSTLLAFYNLPGK